MAGQDRGGNEGFSGTPFWKIQQQMAQYRNQVMAAQGAEEEKVEVPAEPPNVLVDAVCITGITDATKQKALVRHVIVKDLNKIANRMNVVLPKTNVFKDKAPIGLYALFDGQAGATPGPSASEFCARNIHVKVLDNLASLPANQATETFVKAALIKSFEDLDAEILRPELLVQDGCGAAVALIIGDIIFTAVLGPCNAVMCEVGEVKGRAPPPVKAVPLGGTQGDIGHSEERQRLRSLGFPVVGDGESARIRHPMTGALSMVGRSLGDAPWKQAVGPVQGLNCTPEVQSISLRGHEAHPFLLLASTNITAKLSSQELVDLAREFGPKPRAACGEIIARMQEATAADSGSAVCTVVQVAFLPPHAKEKDDKKRSADSEGPAAKKAKLAASKDSTTRSVRLRHLLVKFNDGTPAAKQVLDLKGRPVTRTRSEAESVLRRVIRELQKELSTQIRKPKDPTEIVTMQSKKFAELCREFSDCPSAQKGGAMCGDLGWMMPDQLGRMGSNFKENIDVLRVGEWSDITLSQQGLHLIQKIA